MKKITALAIVLPLAPLSVYTYRLLQEKRSAVPRNYDVFLSFKGPDTRTCFTDFLYNSLVAAGFHVFRDNDSIPVGEQIGPEKFWAIKSCRIAIPIISKQYAQSKRCLRELTEIMDCHKKHGKSVFPVFYKVDVGDVRRQRVNFEKALRKPEIHISPEEMAKWWNALTSVAKIKGWISQTIANGHEAELVKMVVAKVSSDLKTMWIERLPMFVKSVHLHFSEKKRRESQYQVFLAFRGPDTRHSLAAYLYISLVAAGVRVFNDADPSLIGKDVDHEICNAIDHCKISIPILSKDYPSSRWCLDELAQMVECKRRKRQKILPIFYKVRTSHVRDLSGVFGEKILKHEKMVDECTYERWKLALKEVGSFKGWVSERIANGHEGVLVKEVVKEVSRLLKNPKYMIPHPYMLN
ncbi:uncharacterized protein LOC104430442 [Eucalyptus grandis]|uniref:uncharacterized protein LOC104430442 n=1 Tax=Eucalyptus grandis TaxID=71139 RepID=UPI00192EBCA3|nr:uncharacterized protein LOC104430442 [Eucalyptus grandis]